MDARIGMHSKEILRPQKNPARIFTILENCDKQKLGD